MLEGKRFLPDTGIPILKMDRKMVLLAVELPEPFFVPTVIEKSFTTLFMELLYDMESGSWLTPKNLRTMIQKVGMLDQRVIPDLKVAITNGPHHHLMVSPHFL